MTIKSQLLEFLNSKTVTGACAAKHLIFNLFLTNQLKFVCKLFFCLAYVKE